MSPRKTLFVVCLTLTVLCLATGYGIIGRWVGVGLAILTGPAWWIVRKAPGSWGPFLCLFGSVGLGAAGTLLGSPPVLMTFGAAAALAAWDLLSLDCALGEDSSMETTRRYETEHFRSLTLALGIGLAAAMLGRSIRADIPFVVLMLLIASLLVALDRVWVYVKKTGRS